MKKFVVEMCVSTLEKYSDNSLVSGVAQASQEADHHVTVTVQCAQMIKQKMDEKFAGAGYWNVVVGESFEVRKAGGGEVGVLNIIILVGFRSTAAMTREVRC